jgi:hypothetical protein
MQHRDLLGFSLCTGWTCFAKTLLFCLWAGSCLKGLCNFIGHKGVVLAPTCDHVVTHVRVLIMDRNLNSFGCETNLTFFILANKFGFLK